MGISSSVTEISQYCGVSGRTEFREGQSLEHWLGESKCVSFPTPPQTLEAALEAVPPLCKSPVLILNAILLIERMCSPDAARDFGGQSDDSRIDVLVDDPDLRYCLCYSSNSPLVTACMWVDLPKACLEDAIDSLALKEDRCIWDSEAEFDILQPATSDRGHETIFHMLHAPWPFWDRDVLEARWRLPLPGAPGMEPGTAFVMQSIEDPSLYPLRPDRVRANVHMAGHLLRPSVAGGTGVELTVCCKIDIGGIVPEFAQQVLPVLVGRRGNGWADKLREHCHWRLSRRLQAPQPYESPLPMKELMGH